MAEDKNNDAKTGNTQHPIPQNVMAVEFKLIGSLTLRQFVFLGAFLGLAFLTYQSILPSFIGTPLAAGLALLGVFLSLVPIQDRPADVWLKNFLLAISQPTERVWRKGQANLDVFWELKEARTVIKQERGNEGPKDRAQLYEYLHGAPVEIQNPLDLAEHEFLKSVRLLQADVDLPPGLTVRISPTAGRDLAGPELKARAEVVVSPSLASDVNLTPGKIIALPTFGKQKKFVTSIQNVRSGRRLRLLKPGQVGATVLGEKKISPPPSPLKRAQDLAKQVVNLQTRLEEISFGSTPLGPARGGQDRSFAQAPLDSAPLGSSPIQPGRPDRPENGKTTVVWPPASTARLPESTDKTPGVGTSGPNLAQATTVDDEQIKKTQAVGQTAFLSQQLQKLQAEKESLSLEVQKEHQARLEAETLAGLAEEYQRRLAETVSANSQLSGQRRQAQAELKGLQEKSAQTSGEKEELQKQTRALNRRVEDLAREKSQITDSLINLQKELRELRLEKKFASPSRLPESYPLTPGVPSRPAAASVQPKRLAFVKEANLINGYVKNKTGNLLKNAVVIVRDAQDAPVRALKTNELGQFAITTPVANGRYSVEVTSEGEAFAIMTVETYGEILDPLEFVGI